MNKKRRNELSIVITDLTLVDNKDDLEMCICDLERLRDEEQDYFDNMPENLQYSQRGQDAEESVDLLDEAIDQLNDVLDDEEIDECLIEDAISIIEDVIYM